jgi:hypothetical protein
MRKEPTPLAGTKRRGRPKGSCNQRHKAETVIVSYRLTPAEARLIEALLAKGQLRTRMRLSAAQIILQALEEYDAARDPGANKPVNKNIPPEPCLSHPETNELEKGLSDRRIALQHDLAEIDRRAGHDE